MKGRRILAAALLSFLAIGAYGKIDKKLLPTEMEKSLFLNEADDFIDDMAEGAQDRQADAVLHSLHGNSAELVKLRQSRNVVTETDPGVEVKDFIGDGSARGMKMRLYKPSAKKESKLPLLIYFHGGGWTIGSLNSCKAFCEALALTGNVMVLAVDYSLAPENPYPAPLMDCVAAAEYAAAHAEEWGSDPSLVSLGGDSAGGNLALATALYLQDSSTKIRSLVLYYPVVKAYADKSASWKEYSRGYGLDGRLMNAFNEAYLLPGMSQPDEATDAKTELVSPAEADDAKLKKLPPVLMIGAERDILYDQGREFAGRLKKLGNEIDYTSFPGAVHLFITVEGQPTAFAKAVALTDSFLTTTSALRASTD